jgi:DDE superfamily endonuclease
MSSHRWHSSKERGRCLGILRLHQQLTEDTSSFSSSSDSSLSNSSISTVSSINSESTDYSDDEDDFDGLFQFALNYYGFLTRALYEADIPWNTRYIIEDIDGDAEAIKDFRFRKDQLSTICEKLWPKIQPFVLGNYNGILCHNGYKCPFESGILLVLYRLSAPRRLRPDFERKFFMKKSKLSACIKTFMEVLYNLSIPYFDNPVIHRRRIPYYGRLVESKCEIINNCWGFIDGTCRESCRPTYCQRCLYSGHKRCHCIKYQSVVTPDGLIALLHGPVNGNRHDSFLLRDSELLPQLESLMPINNIIYALYGDPAYPQSALLFGGYRDAAEGSIEEEFNTEMSRVRVVVEWGFQQVTQQFTYIDFKREMMLLRQPVYQYYHVAAFLCNIRSIFYGSNVATYFGAVTYSLDEYLDLVDH